MTLSGLCGGLDTCGGDQPAAAGRCGSDDQPRLPPSLTATALMSVWLPEFCLGDRLESLRMGRIGPEEEEDGAVRISVEEEEEFDGGDVIVGGG